MKQLISDHSMLLDQLPINLSFGITDKALPWFQSSSLIGPYIRGLYLKLHPLYHCPITVTMYCLPTHLSIILSKGQALNSKH